MTSDRKRIVGAVEECLREKFRYLCFHGSRAGNELWRLQRMFNSMLNGGSVSRNQSFVDSGNFIFNYVEIKGRVYRIVERWHSYQKFELIEWCPSFDIDNTPILSESNDPYIKLTGWKTWPGIGESIEYVVSLKSIMDESKDAFKEMKKSGWASWMIISEQMLRNCCLLTIERMIYWLACERSKMLFDEACDRNSSTFASLQATANSFFADVAEYLGNGPMKVRPEEWTRLWKENARPTEHPEENPWHVHLASGVCDINETIEERRTDKELCPSFVIGCPELVAHPSIVSRSWPSYCSVTLWYNTGKDGEDFEQVYVSDLLRVGTYDAECLASQSTDVRNVFERMNERGWGWGMFNCDKWWSNADAARVVIQSLIEWSRPYLDNYIKMLNNGI